MKTLYKPKYSLFLYSNIFSFFFLLFIGDNLLFFITSIFDKNIGVRLTASFLPSPLFLSLSNLLFFFVFLPYSPFFSSLLSFSFFS